MSEQKQRFATALTKVNDAYLPMIEEQFTGHNMNLDDYAKKCVMNGISSINSMLDDKGMTWNDQQLDQSNVTTTLLKLASLKLNASASPSEVYFQIRNVKKKVNGKDVWKKQVELGIEGDGNDAILSNFGRNVKEVRQHWEVREGDEFEYPRYEGIDIVGPKWVPKGKGKVIRVVYPIIKTSGTVEYHIAEREHVIRNLIAHIENNLMNETFGIAENRYKASAEQKKQIDQKKKEIIQRVEELGLDDALSDEEIKKHVSPAWKNPQSKESMIVRKMRNNIVKKIPKDFGSALTGLMYDKTNDEEERVRKEINENANKKVIDIDIEDKPKGEQQPNPQPTQEEEPETIDFQNISKEKPPF